MATKKTDITIVTKRPKKVIKTQALVTAPTTSPEALIAQAIASGASVDTMERLLAMRRELKEEHAKEAFNTAMAMFQAECPIIKKTKGVKTNKGVLAYQYAPIESIVKQVKALIQKHGFRYATSMELSTTGVKATCRVVHALGHSEETPMEVPLGTKTDIMSNSQVVAAAQTFAKRYAFCNAFGIMTGDDDNDGANLDLPSKPAPMTQTDQLVKKVIDLVSGMTGQQLTEVRLKIEESKKYSEKQKKEIFEVIDARLTKLMVDQKNKI
jgi:hypothetical protein